MENEVKERQIQQIIRRVLSDEDYSAYKQGLNTAQLSVIKRIYAEYSDSLQGDRLIEYVRKLQHELKQYQ